MATPNDADICSDLEITSRDDRAAGGTWVQGTLSGHRFEALVFAGHADDPANELGDSRIAKLWVRRESDQKVVGNFDRGWDVRPADAQAKAIVDFLAAGLAEHIFG